ncbi:MAG TPA: hypothetical protein PLM81_08615 [Ginsengibacter sp.]|nr:hypothetical protein [Ginsengibacter sp.]HRP17201.1 hypothetical protein [Ginsengibacter sp.]HRP45202.1 hypothetical protein [Ginsengibacter sp.]
MKLGNVFHPACIGGVMVSRDTTWHAGLCTLYRLVFIAINDDIPHSFTINMQMSLHE